MPLNGQSPFDPCVPPDPAPTSTPRLNPSDAARLLSALSDCVTPHLPAPSAGPRAPAGFIIDCSIGRGGTASVYKAFQVGALQRPVAIKIYDQLFSPDAASRVLRELDLWQSLDLNCLPTLIQSGLHEGRLFVVTTFVDGDTLLAHARSLGLSIRERVELLARAADAVQALNARGVLHRDIKPSNIMVAPDGRIVLIDLGLARLMDSSIDTQQTLTAAGTPVGTPAFMAPEQARGERIASTQTDVWGLGAAAYTLLTDHTPHATDAALHEVIRRIAQDPPRDPRSLSPTLPRPLAAILSKACAFDPAHRYRTAAELADDFRRWLRNEPVTAGGSPARTHLTRWITRHPTRTAVACVLVVALFAGLAAATAWQAAMRRPVLTVSAGGSAVALEDRFGRQVKVWQMNAQDQVLFARAAFAPSGERVAILAFGKDGPQEWAGSLLVVNHDRPDNVIFEVHPDRTSFSIPAQLPGAARRAGMEGDSRPSGPSPRFVPRSLALADIFPDLPGDELLTGFHNSNSCESCVRIYRLDGSLIMECWHYGWLSDLRWLSGSGVIVGSGATNRDDLSRLIQSRGGTGDRPHALVAFVVRPRQGVFTWIDGATTDAGNAGSALHPEWYKYLQPWTAYRAFTTCRLGPSRVAFGSTQQCALVIAAPGASVHFELMTDGTTQLELTDERYPSIASETGTPPADQLYWADLASPGAS